MNNQTLIAEVTGLVEELTGPEPQHFLVDVRVKPTNNIKVFIDGDQGISIEKLVQYNRALYKKLEESGMFPAGDFSLEVSSPGLDEPLRMKRQYLKNVGRFVEVTDPEGLKKEGKLVGVSEDGIQVEETRGKGKKQEIVQHEIPFDHIKTTKIQIKF
jgi:ribosome maturation factor RimP